MTLPTKPRLEGAIRSILAPLLREDGYLGSGRTYRRVRNNLIQVVNVQGSIYGGSFAVNLAVQPLAVADFIGKVPNPKRIGEANCILRTRLSLLGESDQWWDHCEDEASMDFAMSSAASVYTSVGRDLMERISEADSPLFIIEPMQLNNPTGKPFLASYIANSQQPGCLLNSDWRTVSSNTHRNLP
jgi:hypothetical protein